MAITLNDIEFSVDTLSKRVEQLINERNTLRKELTRHTNNNLENNKAFIRAYQENVMMKFSDAEKVFRLEHMLESTN